MTRRPAVTLIEVLVTLFIMAIGMLALLTLFPLGVLSMGRALKDDRCASTAAMAENVAIAMNVRHDFNVVQTFTLSPGSPVYVDPYGVQDGLPSLGGVIQRIQPGFVQSALLIDRWFSLPDDLTFMDNGTPDLSSAFVQRGRRYSYAYLLRRPQPLWDRMIQLFVVVYRGRPVGTLTAEPTYPAVGAVGANGLTLSWGTGQSAPNLKRGSWILDTTSNGGIAQGYFYRVTNLVNTSPNSMVVEVERNLLAGVNTVTIMDYVEEVFDKGISWQP